GVQPGLHDVVDHHRGVDPGGVHRVDTDAVRGQRVRVGAHQADHAVLGGGVAQAAAAGAADAGDPGGGTGQHDRAARAALDHGRDRDLHRVEHPGEVDVDDVLPGPVELLGQCHRRDTRVGQHDVDRAELGHTRLERRPQPGL